jgi:hypothetical protein
MSGRSRLHPRTGAVRQRSGQARTPRGPKAEEAAPPESSPSRSMVTCPLESRMRISPPSVPDSVGHRVIVEPRESLPSSFASADCKKSRARSQEAFSLDRRSRRQALGRQGPRERGAAGFLRPLRRRAGEAGGRLHAPCRGWLVLKRRPGSIHRHAASPGSETRSPAATSSPESQASSTLSRVQRRANPRKGHQGFHGPQWPLFPRGLGTLSLSHVRRGHRGPRRLHRGGHPDPSTDAIPASAPLTARRDGTRLPDLCLNSNPRCPRPDHRPL